MRANALRIRALCVLVFKLVLAMLLVLPVVLLLLLVMVFELAPVLDLTGQEAVAAERSDASARAVPARLSEASEMVATDSKSPPVVLRGVEKVNCGRWDVCQSEKSDKRRLRTLGFTSFPLTKQYRFHTSL